MQNLNENMLHDYRSMKYIQNFLWDKNFKVKQT